MHVGLTAIFPTRNDSRVSIESSTSALVDIGSALDLSINSDNSSSPSINVVVVAYTVRDDSIFLLFLLALSLLVDSPLLFFYGSPTTMGISSTHPLSRFHCMLSSVLK